MTTDKACVLWRYSGGMPEADWPVGPHHHITNVVESLPIIRGDLVDNDTGSYIRADARSLPWGTMSPTVFYGLHKKSAGLSMENGRLLGGTR